MSSNYTLEIISHHPQFAGKSLKQYHVEGINTIGVWGSEEFSIVFKNHTWQKVQVKLTLDGTDIMTGKPATTDASDKMWVVNAYGTLSLKAFPETQHGGAAFVFTSADNSVALHTHGDLSSRGIIAAAVFVEGHRPEPARVDHYYHNYSYPYYSYPYWSLTDVPITCNTAGVYHNNLMLASNSCSSNNSASQIGGSVVDCFSSSDAKVGEVNVANSLQSLAAIGAGQYTEQSIVTVAGLIKPILSETVRVRYIWWDALKEKLQQNNVPAPHASGFPGDTNRGINLGNTPRLPSQGGVRRAEPVQYSRV